VRRPVWEDPLNLSGGKWIIRLKKGVADRIWEDLVLGIIGDQFDECTADRDQEEGKPGIGAHDSGSEGGESSGEWPEICGATLSVRQSEDILSVWNRVDGDMKLREKIR
jgi:translation initiation factor 4E